MATYTNPKQNNFCASKEDAILGRSNEEAAGVSGTALPEAGWPASTWQVAMVVFFKLGFHIAGCVFDGKVHIWECVPVHLLKKGY